MSNTKYMKQLSNSFKKKLLKNKNRTTNATVSHFKAKPNTEDAAPREHREARPFLDVH